MFLTAASGLPPLDLSKIVLAIGALGTAAYGVVDVSKGFGGGISNRGFGDIKNVVSKFIPTSPGEKDGPALSLTSVLITLRANWLNGMALADQKAVAKSLIKLNLNESSSDMMAATTGLDPTVLKSIAAKLSGKTDTPTGKPDLPPTETPTDVSTFCSMRCWTRVISGLISATGTAPSWWRGRWGLPWRCWERGPSLTHSQVLTSGARLPADFWRRRWRQLPRTSPALFRREPN